MIWAMRVVHDGGDIETGINPKFFYLPIVQSRKAIVSIRVFGVITRYLIQEK